VDAAFVLALHQWATSQTWIAGIVLAVAQAGLFVVPVVILGVWLVARAPADGRREAVLVGVIAAVLAAAVGLVLERTLNRPRPFAELGFAPLFPHAADASFPSDHTLVGVALVGPMLWRAPKLGIWLMLWALLIGFARVAAGVHYPTDIVGTAILALALDGLVWIATQPARRRINLQRWGGGWPDSQRGARPRSTVE
jgi:undecaprenyl-diphosphatase